MVLTNVNFFHNSVKKFFAKIVKKRETNRKQEILNYGLFNIMVIMSNIGNI